MQYLVDIFGVKGVVVSLLFPREAYVVTFFP